jgi:triacylglycerol lipase
MTAPILVLLHGYLGFAEIGPVSYFRNLRDVLNKQYGDVIIPQVPPTSSIAERATSLVEQLFGNPAHTSFVLLAHSMGGLDARYLITRLDPDHRIKTLVTVATPHRGSSMATWFLQSAAPLPAWIRNMGTAALHDLTPAVRASQPIPDRPDVTYISYAGHRAKEELPLILRPYADTIDGDHDGMVPVNSAKWGEFRGVVRADHLELIGWSLGLPDASIARPFDYLTLWSRVAAGVAGTVR